ncbi:MAG: hypothetical protein WCT85_02320 [Parachlamydiales bacterium]|jgi:hypothetical protein
MTNPINQSRSPDFAGTEQDLGGRFEILEATHRVDYENKTVDKWSLINNNPTQSANIIDSSRSVDAAAASANTVAQAALNR